MPIDRKAFEKLKLGFAYLEKYDKFGSRPDKRVPICITIPLELKKRIEKKGKGNLSRFISESLESHMAGK